MKKIPNVFRRPLKVAEPGQSAHKPPPVRVKRPRHSDDYFVENFAWAMKDKLALKRDEGRGGWESKEECSADFLSQLLREHVEKGDPVDVANFCMMLHQRGERITPADTDAAQCARRKAFEEAAGIADTEGRSWCAGDAKASIGQAYQNACINIAAAIRKAGGADRC